MKLASFYCQYCKKVLRKQFESQESIPMKIKCDCNAEAKRQFNNLITSKEPETVSAALQTMLYSGLPSGRDKAVI